MRLTSMKINYVLAGFVSLVGVGCGDDGGSGGSGGTGNTGPIAGNAGAPGAGTGGSTGGTGGAPVGGPPVMVSDFETASTEDMMFDGYSEDTARGWKIAWFTYTDAGDMKSDGAMITPMEAMRFLAVVDAGRGGGHVANMKGGGFKSWGAGMGFNFVSNPAPPPGAVDLSTFKGISFWIKAADPMSGTVKVKLVDKRNTPVDRGGTCVPGMPTAAARCDDVFLTSVVPTAEWKQETRMWSDFKAEGWGMQTFDGPELNGAIGIQFQVGIVPSFDVSVDDVALIP